MAIDCTLYVDGVPFADTAVELVTGAPTALADLEVVWGRDTTVDQPAAATCTALIVDRNTGADLLDVIDIGAAVDVYASGNIADGLADNVVVDPGFELLPAGTVTHAVAVTSGTATAVTTPVHTGARAVSYDPGTAGAMLIPPAPFDLADPTAWDGLPTFDPSTIWGWSLAVHADYHQTVTVTPVRIPGPTTPSGVTIGPPVTVTATPGAGGIGNRVTFGEFNYLEDGEQVVFGVTGAVSRWRTVTGSTVVTGDPTGGWVGLRVDVPTGAPWTVVPGSWSDTPGTWGDYRGVVVDDVELIAPAGAVIRTVLVFSGSVTDLEVTADRAGALTAKVTSVDQMVDLANRAVGGEPWPAETLSARVAHVIADAAIDVDTRIDPGPGGQMITWVDVDNKAAAALLAEYTAGVDAVLWSATHATTGPFLWVEDPTGRAQLGHLEEVGALVVIVYDTVGRGVTHLDGCHIPGEPVTWVRDVSDVITRVDARWSEQTVDGDGNPKPSEHTVTVDAPPATVTKHGVRRMSITTNLTTETAAVTVAERVLFRATTVEWRATGVTVDAGIIPPAAGEPTTDMLDLLDGTARLGRGLIISNVDVWPGGDTVALYLEGGTYRFDGVWALALNTSSTTGLGASASWAEMDVGWAWIDMDPTIRWFDMYGVAA